MTTIYDPAHTLDKTHPELLQKKFIVFTDFDGTITRTDSNDYLTDNYGMGFAARRKLADKILAEELTFRDGFKQMLDSVAVNKTFDECRQIVVDKIELDPGFKVFLEYCLSQDIPVIVLSGGMEPLISALLQNLVGPNEIPIVSNGVGKTPQGTWEITYHDDSGFGHDKSLAIKPFTEARKNLPEGERPTYFYCGDGVSDLSAAKETDLLFAKEGHDLINYCKSSGMPYRVFKDFSTILADVKDVVEGRKTAAEIAEN
ncbi:HAD-like domain-containing protein [Pyronema omphalodes]|nr:HAD-like domain-containing protein [Pyronema omphalodes]